MTPPVLAIVQARMASTRLPRKMLLPLGGKPLVWWAWNAAVEAFGEDNVVCAIPGTPENDELATVLEGFPANVFRWDGDENDVLGRFYACAHTYRWMPETVLVRVTPDDPFKSPEIMRRVAQGERHPVELGAEAFTLAMLEDANARLYPYDPFRQHMTHALFRAPPPKAPPGIWTVDTQEDYERAREHVVNLTHFSGPKKAYRLDDIIASPEPFWKINPRPQALPGGDFVGRYRESGGSDLSDMQMGELTENAGG